MTGPEHVLIEQLAAWNRGDIDGFCAYCTEDVTYVGACGVTMGRSAVAAQYHAAYLDRAAMGALALTVDRVEERGPTHGFRPSAPVSATRRGRSMRSIACLIMASCCAVPGPSEVCVSTAISGQGDVDLTIAGPKPACDQSVAVRSIDVSSTSYPSDVVWRMVAREQPRPMTYVRLGEPVDGYELLGNLDNLTGQTVSIVVRDADGWRGEAIVTVP